MAVEYSKVREQFGRPIGWFPGHEHMPPGWLRVEPARSLLWYAAYAMSR